jgi:hypothetical protein
LVQPGPEGHQRSGAARSRSGTHRSRLALSERARDLPLGQR